MPGANRVSKAQVVREYLSQHQGASPKQVVEALSDKDINLDARYVSDIKSRWKKNKHKQKLAGKKSGKKSVSSKAKYPRHNLERALRIPQAILEQNAGRECTEKESASFVGGVNSGRRI